MKVFIVSFLLGSMAVAWGQGAPAPIAVQQFLNNNGQPLAGGSLCTFLSGSTSPQAAFRDASLTAAWPQCVPLDSAGRAAPGGIWLDPTKVYRFQLRDSANVTIWTADGVTGALGGSANLWTQNGNTVYNSSGTRVCIGATPCTTALAVLDVAGTGSGATHLIRIDDNGPNPGIDLYGSSGNFFGSYLSSSAGLLLRSSSANQMTVGNGNVTVQNGAATGGTNFNVKMTATQASINPLQIQTPTGSNIAYLDPTGNFFLAGVNANGTANNTIQAPNGGVAGKFVIATDSLFLIEEPAPALSAAGQARIYADSTSHTLLLSQNGGAYAELGSGGGGGGGSFSAITSGTNVTATMTVGTGGQLTFTGSGIVNASRINGTTIPVSSAADQALVTSATGVGAWKVLTDCPDTGGNHVNYTGGAWSCGTSGGTVGSVSFGTITSATNTTSTMVVGTGASLGVSGSGQINATQINAGAPPSSGSMWVSNGILQPVGATFADVVNMFSGGAGCSGTNLLAADGTCQAVAAGSFLPLSGGTMTGNIQFNPTVDVGTSGNPPRDVWASRSFTSLGAASNTLNIPNGGILALNATFGSISNYIIVQGLTPQINATNLGAAFNINGSGLGNGNIVFNPGNVGGLSSVQVNGRSFSNTQTQSLILNEVGGASGSGISMKHSGVFDAAWQAGSGAALDIVGNDAFTHRMVILQNGKVLMNRTSDLGSIALLQVQGNAYINGSSGSNIATLALTLDTADGVQGAGITMKHGGGVFDAAWQAGSGAAFDVVSNSSSHRFIILQTGQVLINRTSDNFTGAVLQVQGGVSFTGIMIGPSGVPGISTAFTCAGSARINSITASGGIITGVSCL